MADVWRQQICPICVAIVFLTVHLSYAVFSLDIIRHNAFFSFFRLLRVFIANWFELLLGYLFIRSFCGVEVNLQVDRYIFSKLRFPCIHC